VPNYALDRPNYPLFENNCEINHNLTDAPKWGLPKVVDDRFCDSGERSRR